MGMARSIIRASPGNCSRRRAKRFCKNRPRLTSAVICAERRGIFSLGMEGRPVCESYSEYSELALPNDANGLGNLLGGKVMHLVDLCGALAAIRHARTPVVTAAIDHMTFLSPVKIGQLLMLRSSVNRVFRTSMEVGVKVLV